MKADVELIDQSTKIMVANGHFILQAHRFADDDVSHAVRLMNWAELPPSARVIDLGCGTGAIPFIWSQMRPDCEFTLVNISQYQLDCCQDFGIKINCSMEDVPVDDGVFDAATCCFAIGHTDHQTSLYEMARIVRRGGVVFIYDMVPDAADVSHLSDLNYSVVSRSDMERMAKKAGLVLDFYMEPQNKGCLIEDQFREAYSRYFADVKPAIWRFTVGDWNADV